MKVLRFQFQPEQVRISAEEIHADLRYPARQSQVPQERKLGRRPRRRP